MDLIYAGTPAKNDCKIIYIKVDNFINSGNFSKIDGTPVSLATDYVYGVYGIEKFTNEKGEKFQELIIKGHCYTAWPMTGLKDGFVVLKSNQSMYLIEPDGSEFFITSGTISKIL